MGQLFFESNKAIIFSINIMMLFLISFNSYSKDNEYFLEHDGYSYKYERVDIYTKYTSEYMYSRGLISVVNSSGDLVYFDMTDYSPGCNGDFSAITILNFETKNSPISNKWNTNEFIGFCGNTGGHHNVLKLYKPNFGIVSTLDFMNGPVEIRKNTLGQYDSAVVFYEVYLKSLKRIINYPVFFNLKSTSNKVYFSSEKNNVSSEYYRKYIKEIDHDNSDINIARILISSVQIEDKELHCSYFNSEKIGKSNHLMAIKNDIDNFIMDELLIECGE